jgi:hypothetical protein
MELVQPGGIVMKRLFYGLLLVIIALGFSSVSAGGISPPPDVYVSCDSDDDRDEGFAYYAGYKATCWRVEVRCESGASGEAELALEWPYGGILKFEAWDGNDYNEWGYCDTKYKVKFGLSKQLHHKCEFKDGSKFEVQAQPAEMKKCFE